VPNRSDDHSRNRPDEEVPPQIRLGPYRIQRCPVHERVEIVHQVDPSTLSPTERAQAALYPAGRIP
jgi:hypothetical protein